MTKNLNNQPEDITLLKWPECVRTRIGMYLGGTDKESVNNLLREIIDNSIDESYQFPGCNEIFIDRNFNGPYSVVADNGRGISIGYNKDVVCAVWVGYDDNKSLDKSEYKYAQNIWYNTVEYYEKDKEDIDTWYTKPKNINVVLVDPISGKPVDETAEKKKFMYFIKGTEPSGVEKTFDEKESFQKET